jgi:hypothetical protein
MLSDLNLWYFLFEQFTIDKLGFINQRGDTILVLSVNRLSKDSKHDRFFIRVNVSENIVCPFYFLNDLEVQSSKTIVNSSWYFTIDHLLFVLILFFLSYGLKYFLPVEMVIEYLFVNLCSKLFVITAETLSFWITHIKLMKKWWKIVVTVINWFLN